MLALSSLKDRNSLGVVWCPLKGISFCPASELVEHKPARVLRSSCERRLEPSTVPGTLQNSAAMLFNSLPQDIKNCTELKVFDSKCRNHFMTLATNSSQSYLYILYILYVSRQYYFHTRVSMLSINFTSSILYNFTCAIHNLCIYIIYVIIHLVARYVFIHIFISTIILFYYIHNAYFINCAIFFNELVQKSHHVEYQ